MKKHKEFHRQPGLTRKLEQSLPEHAGDIAVTVQLPPSIYHVLESVARGDVEGWVRAVVIDMVEGEVAAEELLTEDETQTDA